MRLQGRSLPLLAAVLALAACGSDAPPPAPVGDANFPPEVAGFTRIGAPEAGRNGVVAGYQLAGADPQEAIIATVHRSPAGTESGGGLLPSLDLGLGGDDADTTAANRLARSIAEVRRFYPAASVGPVRPAYAVQAGALQHGRQVTIGYQDSFAGSVQPIALDIVVLCCTADGASYEYRFRHGARVAAAPDSAAFIAALPWS